MLRSSLNFSIVRKALFRNNHSHPPDSLEPSHCGENSAGAPLPTGSALHSAARPSLIASHSGVSSKILVPIPSEDFKWRSTFAPTLLDYKAATSSDDLLRILENLNDPTPSRPLTVPSSSGKDQPFVVVFLFELPGYWIHVGDKLFNGI